MPPMSTTCPTATKSNGNVTATDEKESSDAPFDDGKEGTNRATSVATCVRHGCSSGSARQTTSSSRQNACCTTGDESRISRGSPAHSRISSVIWAQ